MQLDMFLACVARMLVRMDGVAVGYVCVMRRRFVVAFADVFGRGAVVLGRLFVMLGRFLVQFLQLFHDSILGQYISRNGGGARDASTEATATAWRIYDRGKPGPGKKMRCTM
jgi:hypothetical protein